MADETLIAPGGRQDAVKCVQEGILLEVRGKRQGESGVRWASEMVRLERSALEILRRRLTGIIGVTLLTTVAFEMAR